MCYGPEFVSKKLLSWIAAQGIRHRADRARQALAEWRRRKLQRQIPRRMSQPRMVPHARRSQGRHRELAGHYNAVRPHSSLGYLTPNEFAAQQTNAAPGEATGRGAAVFGASAPPPVAPHAHIGHMQQMGAVSS